MFKIPVINRASLWYLLVVLTTVSFTWHERVSSIGVTLLVAHWLFDKNLQAKFYKANQMSAIQRLITLLIWSFFFFHILGLLWSHHPAAGWQSIEVKLTFFLLPFLFSTENYLDDAKATLLFLIFSISCCLSFVYAFYYSFWHHHQEGWGEIISRMNISEGIMHPGYYSNYFAYALVWCVLEIISGKSRNRKMNILLVLLISFLLTALLLLASKTAILYVACFAFYLIWMATNSVRPRLLRYTVFMAGIGLMILGSMQIPSISYRIKETFQDSDQLDKNVPLSNSTGSRMAAWTSEWSLIRENWLTGYGTGEANTVLNSKLVKDGYVRLAKEDMHTHNQVFHTWLDLGIIGVLLLMAILIMCGFWFQRQGNRLAWWLLPLIFLNILTDDMLEVQAGGVFFMFFLTLFIYQRRSEKEEISYS